MSALYTDISPECCAVVAARVAGGRLPAGEVLCADVRGVGAGALAGFDHVHLFCGIGGSPLGFAWAGWPAGLSLVTGGFPCQDISSAGKGAGLEGARSGLYREMLRVIEIKRPLGVLGENVGALSRRGLDVVAGALESLGYDVCVLRVGAWAVGAADQRERWWFVCRRADAGAVGVGNELVQQLNPERRRGVHQSGQDSDGPRARSRVGDVPGGGRGLDLAGRAEEGRAAAIGAGAGVGVGDELRQQRRDAEAGGGGASRGAPTGPAAGGIRWPHPRWCVRDADGVERTIATPQHDWEPPRLFPGTRTVSARWRCALMGYPIDWLDIDPAAIAGLAPARTRDLGRWWNKQGVIATGNAQNPRVVEVIARGMLEAGGMA